MNQPTNIRILGIDFPVIITSEKVNNELSNKLGLAVHVNSEIIINEAYADKRDAPEVLLHEVLHCVDHAMSFDFSEETVCRLSRVLYAVIRDNPELVKYLTSD